MTTPQKQEERERNVVLQQPGGEVLLGNDPNAPPPSASAGTPMGVPCSKCNALYPLPAGSTSWRCRACGHFNSLVDDGGFILCSIS
jgi:LSD1 subclass zinc finger protein